MDITTIIKPAYNFSKPNRRAVLVVEDDTALCSELVNQLAFGGEFMLDIIRSIEITLAMLNEADTRYDAILLNLGLSNGDAWVFCKKLRLSGLKIPIIILTGSSDESDVVRGLDSGANDYITKPCPPNELRARLRAQLRIFEGSEDAVFAIGPWAFRPSARQLLEPLTNKRIRLTDKEASILKFLYRAAGRPVARQVLLNEVWGYNAAVTTHTLQTHVYRLRQKIEPLPASAKLLLTGGGGYLLNLAAI